MPLSGFFRFNLINIFDLLILISTGSIINRVSSKAFGLSSYLTPLLVGGKYPSQVRTAVYNTLSKINH